MSERSYVRGQHAAGFPTPADFKSTADPSLSAEALVRGLREVRDYGSCGNRLVLEGLQSNLWVVLGDNHELHGAGLILTETGRRALEVMQPVTTHKGDSPATARFRQSYGDD